MTPFLTHPQNGDTIRLPIHPRSRQSKLSDPHSTDRYEGGSYNMAGIAGLAAGLQFLMQFGINQIAERLLEITDELYARLLQHGVELASCREGDRRSGIVSFQLAEQDPRQVRLRCKNESVIVNCRAGRIRVSPHVYCNEEDIDRLINALGLG
jgi:cysteine desulfurase/selenocysteine lyase